MPETAVARSLDDKLRAARTASIALAQAPTTTKDAGLDAIAVAIERSAPRILPANQLDLANGRENGLSDGLLDRLRLDPPRLEGLAAAVREIIALPDPVGEALRGSTLPNGLRLTQVRVPFGVVGAIYEARPNVTTDAAALCLKAGNACILRGGREALESNRALLRAVQAGLVERRPARRGGAARAASPIARRSRTSSGSTTCRPLHPARRRGPDDRYVAEHARVPVIKHYKGVCHVYVDAAADPTARCGSSRTRRSSGPASATRSRRCWSIARSRRRSCRAWSRRSAKRVELRGDETVRELGGAAVPPRPARPTGTPSTSTSILAVRVVDELDAAIEHIERYGSSHTESIVTGDRAAAERFLARSIVAGHGERLDAVRRRRRARARRRGGHLDTRLHAYGPMGAVRADQHEMDRARLRPGSGLTGSPD